MFRLPNLRKIIMNIFSTLEIARILGIHRDCILEWIKRGFIPPSIQKARGHGTQNVYSRWDVYGIALFSALLKNGWSRDKANDVYLLWKHITESKLIEERYGLRYFCILTESGAGGDTVIAEKQTSGSVRIILKGDFDFNELKPNVMNELNEIIHKTSDFQHIDIFNIERIIRNIDSRIS